MPHFEVPVMVRIYAKNRNEAEKMVGEMIKFSSGFCEGSDCDGWMIIGTKEITE
jgi:hypothetical protein